MGNSLLTQMSQALIQGRILVREKPRDFGRGIKGKREAYVLEGVSDFYKDGRLQYLFQNLSNPSSHRCPTRFSERELATNLEVIKPTDLTGDEAMNYHFWEQEQQVSQSSPKFTTRGQAILEAGPQQKRKRFKLQPIDKDGVDPSITLGDLPHGP